MGSDSGNGNGTVWQKGTVDSNSGMKRTHLGCGSMTRQGSCAGKRTKRTPRVHGTVRTGRGFEATPVQGFVRNLEVLGQADGLGPGERGRTLPQERRSELRDALWGADRNHQVPRGLGE